MSRATDTLIRYLGILKEYARDYIYENTGLKILALLITAVLWLSVASRPVRQLALQNVPIEYRGLPDSRELMPTNDTPVYARVDLRGPRDVLDSLRPSDLTAVADLSDVEPGVRVIQLSIDRSRLPASVEYVHIEPQPIRVNIEPVVEREVAVQPRWEGAPPPGYERIAWSITPTTVRIKGAQSVVNQIQAVTTETISLAGKTQSFSDHVDIDIGSPNIRLADQNRKVMVSVVIGEVRKERVIEQVPVALVNAPTGARATPSTVSVTVFGPGSVVDRITANDIRVLAELKGDAGVNQVEPKVELSEEYSSQVEVLALTPKSVKIRK